MGASSDPDSGRVVRWLDALPNPGETVEGDGRDGDSVCVEEETLGTLPVLVLISSDGTVR